MLSKPLTTLTDTQVPSAIGTPSVTPAESSVVISWGAATDNVAIGGYEYSLNSGSWTLTSSPLTLAGLPSGTAFTVSIRAYDTARNRGSSSPANGSTWVSLMGP